MHTATVSVGVGVVAIPIFRNIVRLFTALQRFKNERTFYRILVKAQVVSMDRSSRINVVDKNIAQGYAIQKTTLVQEIVFREQNLVQEKPSIVGPKNKILFQEMWSKNPKNIAEKICFE